MPAPKRRPRVAFTALWSLVGRIADRQQPDPAWEDYLTGSSRKRPKVTEQRHWYRFSGAGLPFPVYATFGESETGKLVVTGLLLGAEPGDTVPITAQALRRIPVAELTDSFTRTARRLAESGDPLAAALAEQMRAPGYRGPRAHPGRRGLGDEYYRHVAELYREAVRRDPREPTKTLAGWLARRERREIPMSTVRRWLQEARRRGFLGDSLTGKAGEAHRKETRR